MRVGGLDDVVPAEEARVVGEAQVVGKAAAGVPVGVPDVLQGLFCRGQFGLIVR